MADSSKNRVFEFGDFRLDVASKLLFRRGEQISLTPKAVETLILLVERRGNVVAKDELIDLLWPDTIVGESNLAQYLHVLRKTLGENSEGVPFIETLKRRGYRFNGTVRVVSGESAAKPRSAFPEELPGNDDRVRFAGTAAERFERRVVIQPAGNLAVDRETATPIQVERSDNIYSVSEWRQTPATDRHQAESAPNDKRKYLPVILVFVAILLSAAAIGIYRYSAGPNGEGDIRVPFSGANMSRLTTTGNSNYVALSPDGRYVAHVVDGEDGESLLVRQVAAANDIRIAGPSATANFVWVTFSPDGNFVHFLTLEKDKGEPELFRVPVMGGPVVKIASDIGAPEFSPDGTRIAYMVMNQGESRLLVASADGLNRELLIERRAPDFLKTNERLLTSRQTPD